MAGPLAEIDTWSDPECASFLSRYQNNPKLFLVEVLGITKTWEGQDEIMRQIAMNRRVAVPSGHALGKDYLAAALILWFLYSFQPSVVVATAPTGRQVTEVIWAELAEKFHASLKPLGGRLLSNYLEVEPALKWYAIGFTTKAINKSPGKFQGFHSPNVLVIFSEAQAIERLIWNQSESLMTAGNAKWLAIGNPLVSYGAFYEAIQPKSGWEVVRLNCEDSPNVRERREVIPGMASHVWVDEMAVKYGKDSPVYKSKVNGIAPSSSDSVPIERDWLEWANTDGLEAISEAGPMVVGFDPAGMGANRSVFAVRRGMKLVELSKHNKRPTTEMIGLCVDYLNQGASRLYIDATGLGAPMYDRLVELGFGAKVVAVNFGGRPVDPTYPMPGKQLPSDIYANRVTQLYANLSEKLEFRRAAMAYDEDLNMQLLSREMHRMSNGKMQLEPKKVYTGRGYDSPDEADAVALAFADDDEAAVQVPQLSIEDDAGLDELFT